MVDWNRGYRPTGRFYGPGWEGTPAQDAARRGEETLDAVGTAVDYLGPYQFRYAVGGERMAKEPTLAEALIVDPYLFFLPSKVAQLTRGFKHLKRTENVLRGVNKTKGLARLRAASRVGRHLKPEKALGDIGRWPTWEVPRTLEQSLSNLRRTSEAIGGMARDKIVGEKGWRPGSSVKSGSPGMTRREANKWLGVGGLGAALGGGAAAVKLGAKTGKMTALPVDDLATLLRYNMGAETTAARTWAGNKMTLTEVLGGLRKTPADEAFDYIPAPSRGTDLRHADVGYPHGQIISGGFEQRPMRIQSPEELVKRRGEILHEGLDDIATTHNEVREFVGAGDEVPFLEGHDLDASVYDALVDDIKRKYSNLVLRPGSGHRPQVKRMIEEAYAPGTKARAELDDAAARWLQMTKREDELQISAQVTNRTMRKPWDLDVTVYESGPKQFFDDIAEADKMAQAHLEKHGYAGLKDVPGFYDGIKIPEIKNGADLSKWGLPKDVLQRRLSVKERFDHGIFSEPFMGRNPLAVKDPHNPDPGELRSLTGIIDPEAYQNLSKKEHIPRPSIGMRRDELRDALKGRELVDEIPAVRMIRKARNK